MPNQYLFSALTFGKWKQEARAIKRSTQVPLHEALERVAKSKGFLSWHQLAHEAKQNQVTETAFRSGLIVAYSLKDAIDSFDTGEVFVEDWRATLFCDKDILAWYASKDDIDDDHGPSPTSDSWHDPDEPDDWEPDVCLFRYCGASFPATPRQALPIFDAHCFFAPLFFWHKGRFIDPWQDLAINGVLEMSGKGVADQ